MATIASDLANFLVNADSTWVFFYWNWYIHETCFFYLIVVVAVVIVVVEAVVVHSSISSSRKSRSSRIRIKYVACST